MSNRYHILLVITLGLASQSLFAGEWSTDCDKVEKNSPEAKKICSAIEEESMYLNKMVSPPPFLAKEEIGRYPDSIFPGGLPWSNMPSGGEGGSGGVLPPEGGGSGGGDTGGGGWQ